MRKAIRDGALITAGCFLYMAGICLFIFPHGLLLGGTGGISVILTHVLPFSPAAILSGINILLMVLALLLLGRRMAVRTMAGSFLTTVFISAFDTLFPSLTPPVGNIYLSAAVGAAVIAAAGALLFFVDASSGGTDIIALIIRKYKDIRIGRALLITDILIVLVGGAIGGTAILFASVPGFLIKGLGTDAVLSLLRRLSRGK